MNFWQLCVSVALPALFLTGCEHELSVIGYMPGQIAVGSKKQDLEKQYIMASDLKDENVKYVANIEYLHHKLKGNYEILNQKVYKLTFEKGRVVTVECLLYKPAERVNLSAPLPNYKDKQSLFDKLFSDVAAVLPG